MICVACCCCCCCCCWIASTCCCCALLTTCCPVTTVMGCDWLTTVTTPVLPWEEATSTVVLLPPLLVAPVADAFAAAAVPVAISCC
uniref:Putative secreted peptide n=1 Tax=Anopheles braziliensis TaxID=58242 RepID=A0A2M3ZS22_9DIPT